MLEQEESQTPAPKDSVRFDQLDPIRTLGNVLGPSNVDKIVDASSSQVADQPTTWSVIILFSFFYNFRTIPPAWVYFVIF